MPEPLIATEPFRIAFDLSFFLHANKTTALQIATAALGKLEVLARAQAKRIYYRPAKPSRAPAGKDATFRTKVSLEELHLLQRLVFIESEPYEKQTEGASGVASPSQDDMLVRFLKHVAQITIKRNSFYVTLGVGRVLHNYTTAETMRIHDSLLGDPDGMKDEDYFRARKAVLMQEIRSRFGDVLRVRRVAHGEERFESHSPSQHSTALARESLERFAPWNTPCVAPTGQFEGGRQAIDDQNRIEVNRMHAILHPDCLRRISAALSLDPPDHRLEIPTFVLADHLTGEGPPPDRRRPPDLTESEMTAATQHLANEAARRRTSSAGLLRVLVDGTERVRLDPETSPNVRIEVGSGSELIEVRRSEPSGDVLLAVHLLQERPVETSIILEGGRKISFSVSPITGDEGNALAVELECRKANPARILSGSLQRLFFGEGRFPSLGPALRFAFLALAVAGLGFFLLSRSRQGQAPQIAAGVNVPPAAVQISPSPAEILVSARPTEAPTFAPQRREKDRHFPTKESEERIARRRSYEPVQPPEPEREIGAEGTRAANTVPAAASLQNIKSVYVEVTGDEPPAQRIRELLIRQLRAGRRLRVADTREEADAVLKASWDASRGAAARLVNAGGKVIWPPGRGRLADSYQGSPEESAAVLVRALLKDLGPAEHRP